MGCNIHAFIEVKKKPTLFKRSPRWELVQIPPFEKQEEKDGYIYYDAHRSRNYLLYAFLANVRNYWEESILKPISKPRGIPKDASELYRTISDHYGSDGHSHSYFSLAELLEKVPWDSKWKTGQQVNGIDWEETLREASKEFWWEIMIPMTALKWAGYETRTVFFFDN